MKPERNTVRRMPRDHDRDGTRTANAKATAKARRAQRALKGASR